VEKPVFLWGLSVWALAVGEWRAVAAAPLTARPATPLMTLAKGLDLSIRVSMFECVRLVTGTSS